MAASAEQTSPSSERNIDPAFSATELDELDIIYHNMDIRSNFSTCRFQRQMTVEKQLRNLGRQIEDGCFDFVISVAATKHTFTAIVCTQLSQDEIFARGVPGIS